MMTHPLPARHNCPVCGCWWGQPLGISGGKVPGVKYLHDVEGMAEKILRLSQELREAKTQIQKLKGNRTLEGY